MSTFKRDLINQFKKKEIQAIPEIVAFNFMMALVPMLIVFFQTLAFLSIETTIFDESLSQFIPAELYIFLVEFLETASLDLGDHPILITITIATLSLTISKGVNGIFKAFLITYHEPTNTPGYKYKLTVILTFFLLLSFSAFATFFITSSHVFLTNLQPFIKKIVDILIFTVICFTFFFLLFRLAPNKEKSIKQLLPGCVITTVGFIITTNIFTFYVNQLADFHLIYGSLAIIIILLTWLYQFGWVINLGIQINYVINKKS